MEQESKTSGASILPSGGVMAVVLIAAGAFFAAPPLLKDLRPPPGEPRLEEPHGRQDVEARLWQDPLGAVQRARKAAAAPAVATSAASNTASIAAPVADANADPDEDRHDTSPFSGMTGAGACGTPEVLAVTVDGSPYSEPVEQRRRTRYAVMSALNASGYAPFDTEHLGYFLVPRLDVVRQAKTAPFAVPYEWLRTRPNSNPTVACHRVLLLWIDRHLIGDHPLAGLTELARRLMLPRLGMNSREATIEMEELPRWLVIGPNGSDALRDMAIETATAASTGASTFRSNYGSDRFHIYSNSATVHDDVLRDSLPKFNSKANDPADASDLFDAKGITMTRTIGDDRIVAEALIGELSRRGLHVLPIPPKDEKIAQSARVDKRATADKNVDEQKDPCNATPRRSAAETPDTIAMVADWDTLYGRTQREGFEATRAWKGRAEHAGFCVIPFSYIRGLDGTLPDQTSGSSDKSAGDPKATADDKRSGGKTDGSQIERAEGQAQLDYLRRLARQMRTRDNELKGPANSRGIRAIGVLGNDTHDKLLVLQMLKREFPDVIFFATDLDARYLHPSEQVWTRNLIIASSFGLELASDLQRDTPPFRDTYQTSAFFATRLALIDAGIDASGSRFKAGCLAQVLRRPRLFEIGRTAAFDFSDDVPTLQSAIPYDGNCADAHPAGTRMFSQRPLGTRIATALALLAAVSGLALVVSPTFRYTMGWPPSRPRRDTLPSEVRDDQDPRTAPSETPAMIARNRRLKNILRLTFVVVIALTLAVAMEWNSVAVWLTQGGKPMSLTEGLSTWPTEVMRCVTFMLCIYLIGRGWVNLARGMDDIAREFRLVERQDLYREQAIYEKTRPWWERVWMIFAPRLPESVVTRERNRDRATMRTRGVAGLREETVYLWRFYIVQSRLRSRLARVALCVVVMMSLVYALQALAAPFDFVPTRGVLSRHLDEAMKLLLGIAYFSLLFFVADATLFCVRFIGHLNGGEHAWPNTTVDEFKRRYGLPPELLHDWINLTFIRIRTECICPLVYHPFIILSLLLLARHPFFDNWNLSISTKLAIGVCVMIALGCAIALRRTAEAARKNALRDLDERLMKARGRTPPKALPGDDAAAPESSYSVEQVALLRQRIADMREGAFATYTQQPLLRAALLPFAALGGTSLLDALSLANL